MQERWNPDVVCDMTNMPMFADASADMIVIHHGLEHLHLTAGDDCIRECYRILKPGGSLLLFVPDIYELATAWLGGRINDFIFCVNMWGAYQGDEADFHRFGYTGKTLAEKLRKQGNWSIIKPFDWRPIENADIARDWWVLSCEAIK